MEVRVRDNNVTKAYKILKKKLHSEGVIKDLADRKFYQKPSEKRRLKRKEAINRSRKELAERSK